MMTHWPCTMPTVGKFFVKVYIKENNLNFTRSLVNKKLDDDVEEEELNHDDYESMESSTEQEEFIESNSTPNPNPRDHIKKEKVLRKYFQVF